MSSDIQVRRVNKATITIPSRTFRLGDLRSALAGIHNDSRVQITARQGGTQRDPETVGYVFVVDLATAEATED